METQSYMSRETQDLLNQFEKIKQLRQNHVQKINNESPVNSKLLIDSQIFEGTNYTPLFEKIQNKPQDIKPKEVQIPIKSEQKTKKKLVNPKNNPIKQKKLEFFKKNNIIQDKSQKPSKPQQSKTKIPSQKYDQPIRLQDPQDKTQDYQMQDSQDIQFEIKKTLENKISQELKKSLEILDTKNNNDIQNDVEYNDIQEVQPQRIHKNTKYYQDLYNFISEIKSSSQTNNNIFLNSQTLFQQKNQEQDVQDQIKPQVVEQQIDQKIDNDTIKLENTEILQQQIKNMIIERLKSSDVNDIIKNYLINQQDPNKIKESQLQIKKFVDDSIFQATQQIQNQIQNSQNLKRQFTFNEKISPKNNFDNNENLTDKKILEKNQSFQKNIPKQDYKSLDSSLQIDQSIPASQLLNNQAIKNENIEYFFKKEQIINEINDIDSQIKELKDELNNKQFLKQIIQEKQTRKSTSNIRYQKKSSRDSKNQTRESIGKPQNEEFNHFTQRNSDWLQRKNQRQQQRMVFLFNQVNQEKNELKKCSFKPQTNQKNLQEQKSKSERSPFDSQEYHDMFQPKKVLSPLIKNNINPKEAIKYIDFQSNMQNFQISQKTKKNQKKDTQVFMNLLQNLTNVLSQKNQDGNQNENQANYNSINRFKAKKTYNYIKN